MAVTSWQIRLRRWSLRWRARLSIPSMLAGYDENKVISIVAAVNGGMAILLLTVLAWFIDLPLLFPALGPSAFILFRRPFSRSAAPRSVILGHFMGITVGYLTWRLVTLVGGQPVTPDANGWPVLLSASLAMTLCSVLLISLSCPHPPSCASALIVALGAANGWIPLLGMMAGVVLLTAQAILISKLAGISVPLWSPRRLDAHPSG